MSPEAFPLPWREGWPRAFEWKRDSDSRFGGKTRGPTMGCTRDQLVAELWRQGAKSVVISTNVAFREDGLPSADQKAIADLGAAVYFRTEGYW
ncbi:hypothetical protein [Bradyrhizobium sp. USDA 10063]